MATNYPGAKQTFTDPSGTNTLDSPDHAAMHTTTNDTLEAIQDTVGTTAGTNVLKDFSAGEFPARINAGGTIVQTLTGGTIETSRINSPHINEATAVTSTSSEINITDGGATTERVLNVNCKCLAYLDTLQENLVSGTITKVLLDAETYDIGSDFDTTNNRFVAPVAGYYLVSGRIYYTSVVAGKPYYCYIYVNESEYTRSIIHSVDTNDIVVTNTTVAYVGANQYIELYARQISGVNTVDIQRTATVTNMAVHLLSV